MKIKENSENENILEDYVSKNENTKNANAENANAKNKDAENQVSENRASENQVSENQVSENHDSSDENDYEEIEPETSLRHFTDGNSFKKASEKYSDNMSTAITFFVCGIAGIIVLILNQLRVIKLFETSGPSFIFKIIIFGALFTAFIIIGIYSLKNAKKAKAHIKEETDISDTVMEWLRNNVTIDDIENSYEDTDAADEMKYFSRTAYIKKSIKSKFEEVDDELTDVLADEFFEEMYK